MRSASTSASTALGSISQTACGASRRWESTIAEHSSIVTPRAMRSVCRTVPDPDAEANRWNPDAASAPGYRKPSPWSPAPPSRLSALAVDTTWRVILRSHSKGQTLSR